jgi:hypothetical protein
MIPASEYIKKLIAVNQTGKALSTLTGLFEKLGPERVREVILHSANFAKLKEDKAKGNLSREEEKLALNRLHNSVLEIAESLPADILIEVDKLERSRVNLRYFLLRNRMWILGGIWILIIGLGALLFSVPKSRVQVELEMAVSRAAFVTRSEGDFQLNRKFLSIQIDNFSEVVIPAKEIFLEDQTGAAFTFDVSESGPAKILPAQGSEPGIFFDSPTLQGLEIEPNTMLALTVPEQEDEGEPVIRLDVNPGRIKGAIAFQDSLNIEINHASLEGLGDGDAPGYVAWAAGTVRVPAGEAFQVKFSGSAGPFLCIFEPEGISAHVIDKQNLYIDSLSFVRPEGRGEAKSSILQGNVRFLNNKNRPYDNFSLERHDYLRLSGIERLQLTSMTLSEKDIRMKLTGTTGQVLSGANLLELKSQNPSVLFWIWRNFPVGPVVIILLSALLSIGLINRPFRR